MCADIEVPEEMSHEGRGTITSIYRVTYSVHVLCSSRQNIADVTPRQAAASEYKMNKL